MISYILRKFGFYLCYLPPMNDGGGIEEGEPAEEVVPEAKAPAAEPKAKEPAKAKAEPREDDPLKILANPIVRAEIAKAAQLAANQARQDAEAEATTKAERSKLEETERLRLEKQDAESAKQAANAKAETAGRQRDVFKAVLDGNFALQAGGSDYLEFSVDKLLKASPSLDVKAAVSQVITENPFLVQPAKAAVTESVVVQEPAKEPAKEATTQKVVHHTQAPAKEKKAEAVDTLNMTAAEYRSYKAANHGRRH